MTITSEYIKKEFMRELRGLFERYNAEITAKDYYPGYAECGEDIKMIIDIPSVYGGNGECIQESVEINLGTWFDKDKQI